MIFGWGKKSKSWVIDSTHNLVVQWRYFSLFFCPIASSIVWHVIGENRSDDKIISYEEVQKMFPINTPEVSVWNRYGLLIGAGILIVISLFNK